MDPDQKVIFRSSKPTILDQAEKGTLCKVSRPFAADCDVYKQISSDSNLPCWEFIGTMKKDSVVHTLI